MADYITKIRTQDGDLPYDYNSLANLPSGWKEMRVEIDEPVATVDIDIPNAKKVFLISYIRLNDANNSQTTGGKNYIVAVNGCNAAYPSAYIRTSGGFLCVHEFEKINTFTKSMTTGTLGNGNAWSAAANYQICGWANTDGDKSETINTITFKQYDGNNLFMDGCSWRVLYQ